MLAHQRYAAAGTLLSHHRFLFLAHKQSRRYTEASRPAGSMLTPPVLPAVHVLEGDICSCESHMTSDSNSPHQSFCQNKENQGQSPLCRCAAGTPSSAVSISGALAGHKEISCAYRSCNFRAQKGTSTHSLGSFSWSCSSLAPASCWHQPVLVYRKADGVRYDSPSRSAS